MKVSGFTFLRNGQKLGYPFVASIRSILPLVDEFVIALGPCDDDTEKMLREIGDPKIRIIPTQWNERIQPGYSVKGFVYGQQKSIALFNCTGDWAFYLEADEVVHEDDLPKIRAAMEKHLDDARVEALAFDYLHFYGNANTMRLVAGLVSQRGPHHPQHHSGVVERGAVFQRRGRPQKIALPARGAYRRDDLSLRLGAQRGADEFESRGGPQILGGQNRRRRWIIRRLIRRR